MKPRVRLMATALLATAAVLAGPASADDGILGTSLAGTCNGAVDSQCRYCSYQGGNAGQPLSRCVNGVAGYYWMYCATWVNGGCLLNAAISCSPFCLPASID